MLTVESGTEYSRRSPCGLSVFVDSLIFKKQVLVHFLVS